MARMARVVAPGVPHHVTQRGNRKQQTFFNEKDYRAYKKIMAEWCSNHKVDIWAYCLMPNHIHLIAVPDAQESLKRAISEAHRRYTKMINDRQGWRGCLWQGRFFSCPLDEMHLLSAIRYIELNPVRAGLVKKPEDYRWSSARAHLYGVTDALISTGPVVDKIADWRAFLGKELDGEVINRIRGHQRTGRPMGDDAFISSLEAQSGRILRPRKRGPKIRKGLEKKGIEQELPGIKTLGKNAGR